MSKLENDPANASGADTPASFGAAQQVSAPSAVNPQAFSQPPSTATNRCAGTIAILGSPQQVPPATSLVPAHAHSGATDSQAMGDVVSLGVASVVGHEASASEPSHSSDG
jgi:hypothetical protein